MNNPTIEQLRKLKLGDIFSFNGTREKYKLIAINPNDEFVFEQLTEGEAKAELEAIIKVNQELQRRWQNRLAVIH
jgi:hypothetical protein